MPFRPSFFDFVILACKKVVIRLVQIHKYLSKIFYTYPRQILVIFKICFLILKFC